MIWLMNKKYHKLAYWLGLFACIAALSFLSNHYFHRSICLFQNIWGLPCPSCGMTRAYLSLFRGEMALAFHYHALFALVPLLLYGLIYSKRVFYGTVFIFFLYWLYRMYVFFPNMEPMIFEQKALLPQLYFKLFF